MPKSSSSEAMQDKLSTIMQGHRKYSYWISFLDNCGRIEPVFETNKIESRIFKLDSFAFAPRFSEPIEVFVNDRFDALNKPLVYISNGAILQRMMYLQNKNAHIFKPHLTSQDFYTIRDLIKTTKDNTRALRLLFMISSKKNAFLLSLEKQEAFYEKMQVFSQQKTIFEYFLESKVDIFNALRYAFYPTSSYEFAKYLLYNFHSEILTRFYEIKGKTTPFRLIDICLVYAFFSAREDLMALLVQNGARYEIFNNIFALSDDEIGEFGFNEQNLVVYDKHNALQMLLENGVINQKCLDFIIAGANGFIKRFSSTKGYVLYQGVKYILSHIYNDEFDDEFKIYAKYVESIWHSNTKAIYGLQTINSTLKPYLSRDSLYYGFVESEFNALLNPLSSGIFDDLPQNMEEIFVYCLKYVPHIFSVDFGVDYVKSLPSVADKFTTRDEISNFVKDAIERNMDIIYEF